jgi:hypothetical protein
VLDVARLAAITQDFNRTQTVGGGFDFDPATAGLIGTGSIAGTDAGGTAKLKLVGVVAPMATPTASPTASASASATASSTPHATPTSTM